MGKIKIILTILFVISIVYIIKLFWDDSNGYLGSGYTYKSDTEEIYNEYPDKFGEIPPTIISFDYNNKFVIAKQKPRIPINSIYKDYNYSRGDSATYYWIIIKRQKITLGPLNINEFEKLKEKYDIPNSLSLK